MSTMHPSQLSFAQRVEPAHGKCFWSAHPITMPSAEGRIVIGDDEYRVTPLFHPNYTFGPRGFRLEKVGTDQVYEITVPFVYQGNADGWLCDCKDAQYRRKGENCKHSRGLHALMAMKTCEF